MIKTLEKTKIEKTVFSNYSRFLNENDKINIFLDQISEEREKINSFSKAIKNLGNLLLKITWLDNLSENDEIIIASLLDIGKKVDKFFKKRYAEYKNFYAPQKLFKEELKMWKSAIQFHNQTVKEVYHIIFVLRKDKEFIDLCNLINHI